MGPAGSYLFAGLLCHPCAIGEVVEQRPGTQHQIPVGGGKSEGGGGVGTPNPHSSEHNLVIKGTPHAGLQGLRG